VNSAWPPRFGSGQAFSTQTEFNFYVIHQIILCQSGDKFRHQTQSTYLDMIELIARGLKLDLMADAGDANRLKDASAGQKGNKCRNHNAK